MERGAGEAHAPLALTGATGFVGAAVLRAGGGPIRALIRRPGALGAHGEQRVVLGDLNDPAALRELVAGAAAIIHLAGLVKARGPAAFHAANVAGARALAKAANEVAPEARFVHVSSLAAREPQLSDYARTKREGEAAVAAEIAPERLVILRPGVVYGPGDRAFVKLIQAMRLGVLPAPGGRDARLAIVHVDDLAVALLRAASGPHPGAGPFELGETARASEIAEIAARALRRRVRIVRPPAMLAHLAIAVARVAAVVSGGAPMLTPGKWREATHPDWSADPRPFAEAAGWAPRIPLAEGLAREVAGGDQK